MSFSNEFLWGVATSAFQYEGAYLEDGKGWTVADERCKKKNKYRPIVQLLVMDIII